MNQHHAQNKSNGSSERGSNSPHPKESKQRIKYPFRVDYNDHFETPRIAYEHILPVLDAVAPYTSNDKATAALGSKKKKRRRKSAGTTCGAVQEVPNSTTCTRNEHIIYDPYYCNGKMKQLFYEFGFTDVQHEKRDFYKDIKNGDIPFFNTLVTNPPYSENHKEKCMQFAMDHLRNSKLNSDEDDNTRNKKSLKERGQEGRKWQNKHKPFFILMPNYVACRNHFRSSIMVNQKSHSDPLDILYIVPSIPYEYEHPEGTGKDIPPFHSIWYCGIPLDRVDKVKEAFRAKYGKDSVGLPKNHKGKCPSLASSSSSPPRLFSSLSELKQFNAVPTLKRPNPRQRKKAKLEKSNGASPTAHNGITSSTVIVQSKRVDKKVNKKRKRY